jgi:hypothetical protein
MRSNTLPEVWLRGPLNDIPALLQPVAHALLQAQEELNALMQGFPDYLLFENVAGLASPAFHLQHLTGVIDRLFTYAGAERLTAEQLRYLSAEGKPTIKAYTAVDMVVAFDNQVARAISQLSKTDEATLNDRRGVGRAQLPSTVIGLYVHSAEHTMRHLGQLMVTVSVLKEK